MLAFVMVESREAIKNINEILSVPGLAGVIIGPHDLSMDLGVGTPESNPGAPEVEDPHHVLVGEGRAYAGFTLEARDGLLVPERAGGEDLDRDPLPKLDVRREAHDAHASLACEGEQLEAIGDDVPGAHGADASRRGMSWGEHGVKREGHGCG